MSLRNERGGKGRPLEKRGGVCGTGNRGVRKARKRLTSWVKKKAGQAGEFQLFSRIAVS